MGLSDTEIIYQTILSKIPSKIIDLKNVSLVYLHSIETLVNDQSSESLNAIVFYGFKDSKNQSNNFKYYIDFMEELIPNLVKPKTLVILLNNNLSVDYDIISVYKYAWSKKFLHFSIVQRYSSVVTKEQNCIFHYYNPFYKIIDKKDFHVRMETFSDKLGNVNGYDFKLGLISADKYY